ncbi:SHOCT domain-containing protein [Microbacterium allomyrinae]|jgi:hypothetical protein|uniref:SHOCT domain-containing protein n=1 Tax=Microbacterium allomyrinae TaxID=2830666 RepID=A0A9X1LXS9_9MICO|nr:SHOCT domain-containing protein [Microbacterium allomyrinae]MCC2033693.1 SHOCT domain-containing protein [Microbacterium allomyrinae]
MNLWDYLVWIFWIWLMIACLWIFIWIVIDVFRDHTLNGWAKALWVIFLVLLPFLGALVYLIARGGSMTAREAARASAAQQAQAAYIRDVAGTTSSPSPANEIERAQQLLASGTITQAEFDSLKAKALA